MGRKKLLLISLLTFCFVLIVHILAMHFYWYWTIRWLDIPVHILGGFSLSMFALWISLHIKHISKIDHYTRRAVIVVFCTVIIVGIFWELFELKVGITSLSQRGYFIDTLSDIFNNIIGGVITLVYFLQRKKATPVDVLCRDCIFTSLKQKTV